MEGALHSRHRDLPKRLLWIFEGQDASKMPARWAKRHQDTYMRPQDASKRPQDASKTAQEASKTAPRSSKTVFLSQYGPMLAPTWSHVGLKIAFRRYLMLKQPESKKCLFFQYMFNDFSKIGDVFF